MSSPSPIVRQCLSHAVASAGPLLERCLDQAIAALQDAENKATRVAERQEIADAWRELFQRKPAWVGRYPGLVEQALNTAPAPAAPAAKPPPKPASLDSLTLVDDSELAQSLEASRLTQLLLPKVEQALTELDGLMSSALGLPAVAPERNPLRPEQFAQALRGLMAELPAEQAALAAHWSRQLAGPLGRELDALYRDTTRRLTEAKVQAAGYRVLPVASGPVAPRPAAPAEAGESGAAPLQSGFGGLPGAAGAGGGGAFGPGGHGVSSGASGPGFGAPASGGPAAAGPAALGASGAPWASNDPRMQGFSAWAERTRHDLDGQQVQSFLFHGVPQSAMPLAPAYYTRVDQELAELATQQVFAAFDPAAVQQYAHLPAVDRPARAVGTDSPLSPQAWGSYAGPRERAMAVGEVRRQAREVGQVLGMEAVHQIVNQVAQDPRLLAPVREAVVALEPSLQRLALHDPRYFGDEQHPARRLVERVAERSFRYNDEFGSEFCQFAQGVQSAFNGLNAQDDLQDEAPFRQALERLESEWSEHDAAEADRREEVLDAVRLAEKRQAQADQIAWELSHRSDLDGAPAVVQDFLFGPWSLVMAHARIQAGHKHIDPGGHGAVISDLLWSVKRELTLREPKRLIEIVPPLLDNLRSGLATLGHDPQESDRFFRALEKLHRPVLKLRARHRREVQSAAMALEEAHSAAMALDVEVDADHEDIQPAQARKPQASQQVWMAREELDAAGFEDTLPSDHAELIDLRERAAALGLGLGLGPDAPALPEPPVQPAEVIAHWKEGSWVDLHSKGRWLRARLVWASTKRTLFMFVSTGGQPHSMTLRTCEKLLRERLLRPVDSHAVVDEALHRLREQRPRQEALAA